MNIDVAELLQVLQTLPDHVRAEITHHLWESIPSIKEELFTYYDQETFEEIRSGINETRFTDPSRLTAEDVALRDRTLAMPQGDRVALTHVLWQGFSFVDSIFGGEDPEFIAELNRRIADHEAGRTKSIPHEEVMRRMKEKFG